MDTFERSEAAERSGSSIDELDRMVALDLLTPNAEGRFPATIIRRVGVIQSLVAAGMPLELLAGAVKSGDLSFDFLDDPSYSRFAMLTSETFGELAARTGLPLQLVTAVREATGSPLPLAEDRVREDEMPIMELIEAQVANEYRPFVVERSLRTVGVSLRRVAEVSGDTWRSEVLEPLFSAGISAAEYGSATAGFSEELNRLDEAALMAIYRAQTTHVWTANIIGTFGAVLQRAGLHSYVEHPPAMCFLDITGYTRLTQEQGDDAAAELASNLARLVERTSVRHGGRPVEWLGDGVMFIYPDPGPGVVAALEMVAGVAEAGLPPAHVGLHCGPVVFQEGDYYGQTVNLASRIADYARPGEVLVSQDIVDASARSGVVFREIGPVELKGVAGALRLYAASPAD